MRNGAQTKKRRLSKSLTLALSGIILLGGCMMNNDEKENWLEGQFTAVEDIARDAPHSYFYRNPSKINNIGDPFIIRDHKSGGYIAIATSASIGYYGWPSDDLVNWGSRSWIYERPSDSWSTDSYWAPEVVYYRNLYYMFYTARNQSGRLVISVATAEDAAGPYTDVSEEALFDPGYAIIDASVFIDDDGAAYMYYARDCSENIQNGQAISENYGVRLADDLLSFQGEPQLLTRPDQRWENPLGQTTWNEGPIVLKHKDRYYLAYSANFFESPAYSVGYAVSEAPLGPYTKSEDNPILTAGTIEGISGSGHHSYVHSPDGNEVYAAYHTHTDPKFPSGNRQLCIDRVLFTEDGELKINGPTLSWQPAPSNDQARTLTAADMSLYVNGSDTLHSDKRLFDGLQAIHPSDTDRDVELDVDDNGQAELKIRFSEERQIVAIALAAGTNYRSNISSIKLRIGEQEFDLGEFRPTGPNDATLAGTIDAEASDEARLIFAAEKPDEAIILSEIYLIESK